MDAFDPNQIALYVRLIIFAVFFLLVLVFFWRTRNRSGPLDTRGALPETVAAGSSEEREKHVLATLTVEKSDDTAMQGRVIYIVRYPFTLGRNPGNDFVFPGDLAVSNFHAKLTLADGQVMLSEIVIDARGSEKHPRYGTYVNGEPVRAKSIALADGDVIRLGSRLELLFHRMDPSGLPGTVDEQSMRRQ